VIDASYTTDSTTLLLPAVFRRRCGYSLRMATGTDEYRAVSQMVHLFLADVLPRLTRAGPVYGA